MSFMDILKGSTDKNVNYVPGMVEDIGATLKFKNDVVMPQWAKYMRDVDKGYEENMPGIMKAAQGGAGYAGQLGQTFGELGEAGGRTGISGLSQFFDPSYGQEQFGAAMAPIQAQYQQNIANQGANFGGAGNLGSARQALAGQQLAGANQGAQMQAAAQVMNNLNNQRLQAGQALGQFAPQYFGQGLNAKQAQLGFAERPLDYISQRGKAYGLLPSQLYTPQYPGQQGTSETKTPGLKDLLGVIGL